jgi:RNase P subunit RPR2
MAVKKGKSLKQRRALDEAENQMAWDIARAISKMEKVSDRQKHFCPKCKRFYCHGGNKDAYCETCHYVKNFKNACLKIHGITVICQNCGNERRFK